MAREIKILKCPQCGSTDKTDLKPDVFQCNNCKTIYYLENDDVDINYNDNRLKKVSPLIKNWMPVVIAFVVLMFFFMIFYFQPSDPKPDIANTENREVVKEKKPDYDKNGSSTFYMVEPKSKRPIVLTLEERTYNDQKVGSGEQIQYLVFYDPLEKKVLKEIKLGLVKKGFTAYIYQKIFSNNRTYLIYSPDIYEVDTKALEVHQVNKALFAIIAKAQEGLQSLKFTEYGDGLQLTTNEEEVIYYFPIINKTYSSAAYEKAAHGFASLLPGAKEITYHQFTESKDQYSNYKLQLLRIKYLDNGAGPKTFQKFFVWSNSYIMGEGYRAQV